MTQTFDVRSNAYKIAIESFNEMAADQAKPAYRANYRTAAMEAIAGPDAGMVIERLYQGMVSRSGINFGKIPESQGNLQKFTKYEDLSISINLLHRQLDEYNIPEMKVMSELHDNLIRCRDDFVFGYKADSQFIKTTYETMVELLVSKNLNI